MEFEFDNQKSRSNKEKHGIDFVEAQALWHDIGRVEIPARTKDEPTIILFLKGSLPVSGSSVWATTGSSLQFSNKRS